MTSAESDESRRESVPGAGVGVVRTEDADPDAGARRGGAPAATAADNSDRRSFEQLVDELERITERLAGGDLGIEAATDLYEQAEHLHALATARLAQVEARIDRLRSAPAPRSSGPTR